MLSYRCSEFLDLLHIPAILSTTLENKLTTASVGVEGKFKVAEREGQRRLVSCAELSAFEDIWVLPHTHSTTRSKIYSELEENDDLRRTLTHLFHLPPQTSNAVLFEEYWSWCFGYTVGLDNDFDAMTELEWHIEAPEILAIPHTDTPNVIVRALPSCLYESLDAQDVFRHGASILCVASELLSGQVLKRDILPRKRTKNRIARLLALIGDAPGRWAHESELAGLRQINDCTSPLTAGTFEVAKPIVEKADARPHVAMTEFAPATRKVFTDDSAVRRFLTHPSFEKTDEFDESDILFAAKPVASFNALGRRLVNQFPHESALICPKRLLHAVRGAHHGQADSKSNSIVIGANGNPLELFPEWFPLSFDLKTELKLFLEIQSRLESPWWLLISGEAGVVDWCITSKAKTVVKYLEANDGNWVAQQLIPRPFLTEGKKLTMSFYLLVRSFDPVDAYLYKNAIGKVASMPYSLDAEYLAEEFVHQPFDDFNQTVIIHEELRLVLAHACVEWEDLLTHMTTIVTELLVGLSRQIGSSQRSRAVYQLDFNLPTTQEKTRFQPQLSRAVFAPNLEVPSSSDADFVNHVFDILFLKNSIPESFIPINNGLESDSDESDTSFILE